MCRGPGLAAAAGGATRAAPRVRWLRGRGRAQPGTARSSSGLWRSRCRGAACPGTPRRETAALPETRPRSSGDHEGKINSAAGEGPWVLPEALALGRRGQKAEIWDGFPRASMWLKSPQNFEREISPLLHFTLLSALSAAQRADCLCEPLSLATPQKPALVSTGSDLGLEFGRWCSGNNQPFVCKSREQVKSKEAEVSGDSLM